MRKSSNQLPGAIEGQLGIRIYRDHVANRRQDLQIADFDRERVACAHSQAIEVLEFAALPFPPHPLSLRGVPLLLTMEQEERRAATCAVFAVQAANPARAQ